MVRKFFMFVLLLSEFAFCKPGTIYTSSQENTEAIKVIMAQTGNTYIDIAKFDTNSSIKKPICRYLVSLGEPSEYTSYIQNALRTELAMGGMLNGSSTVKLTGIVKKIESNASVYGPYWLFSMELISSNGKKLDITSKYSYSPEWNGTAACNNHKQAIYPAVQKLIYETLTNPEFAQLIK